MFDERRTPSFYEPTPAAVRGTMVPETQALAPSDSDARTRTHTPHTTHHGPQPTASLSGLGPGPQKT